MTALACPLTPHKIRCSFCSQALAGARGLLQERESKERASFGPAHWCKPAGSCNSTGPKNGTFQDAFRTQDSLCNCGMSHANVLGGSHVHPLSRLSGTADVWGPSFGFRANQRIFHACFLFCLKLFIPQMLQFIFVLLLLCYSLSE